MKVSLFIILISSVLFSSDKIDLGIKCLTGNDGAACTSLGYSIQKNLIEGTREDTLFYYGKGCDLNNPLACSLLSGMMAYSDKGDKDVFKGFDLAKKAFELRSTPGITQELKNMFTRKLALLYADGIGTRQSDEKAVELYSKACNDKDSSACVYAGEILRKKNSPLSLEYYGKGCDYKSSEACQLYKSAKNKDQ